MGVMIGAVSVAVFKMAAFGVDPFQSFMSGISKLIPINLFLLGYVTEYSYKLLRWMIPEPSMPLRVVFLIAGIVIICIGSSLYITADLGVSTYDAVALIMVSKWKVGKFKFIRICTDVCCVVLGSVMFIAGGGKLSEILTIAGIGTIITAFFMGPLIEFFSEHFARKLLNDKEEKSST